MTDQQENKRQPAESYQVGNVDVSIWQNATSDGRTFYNATFSRAYKDSEGNLQRSSSFSRSQLRDLGTAVNLAEQRLQKLQAPDRKETSNLEPTTASRQESSSTRAQNASPTKAPAKTR